MLGRGSKLIGGTLRAELTRDEVERVLVDGFFPGAAPTRRAKRAPARVGLRELGLPFAADAAITRHLAAFLGAVRRACRRAVLFNGGVMKAARCARASSSSLDSWDRPTTI